MSYDKVIFNGNILTLEDSRAANAVGFSNGKIKKIWFDNLETETKANQWIDLDGRTLIPGFIDTHNHLFMYSQQKQQLTCSTPPNKTVNDILSLVKTEIKGEQEGKWIVGAGYDNTKLAENRHITRAELDEVAPDNPVFIRHISGHLAVVNSKAFEYCEVSESIENPPGGHFGRDTDGKLDGVIYELPALERIMQRMPRPTTEELINRLEAAAHDYLKVGITTSTDAAVGLDLGYEEYKAHMEAVRTRKNPLYMRYMIMHHLFNDDGEFAGLDAKKMAQRIENDTNGRGKLDSVKLFQDGSIQGRTAALRDGYYGDEYFNGELIHSQETLNALYQRFHNEGFRITTHGNGDLAIASIIEGYSKALDLRPKENHLHRIEHLQTARDQDLEKMAKYKIATSVFINHVYYWGDDHRDIFLGPDRGAKIDPLASVSDHGILYTLHSDCPITPISPLFSIWAAANRLTKDGYVLGEDEKISVLEGLKSMTIYGAKLNGTEDVNGSIKEGKRADFAILDRNLLEIDPVEIKDVVIESTMIDGEIVFEREQENK
ncbi:amidohydrolase [Virgibacillus litoralis]|uniref:Amidohydrolase YtcJ n=1 Tax=Virgibacillus litoralis TaxID=578221 RepID=A0ABS4HG33_9BACI|nr:amidohydrolase [Virgibacillus litoralis]MBP1949865.1 putative amidohydrolase YtcJ [Virgibacillus litoralis]